MLYRLVNSNSYQLYQAGCFPPEYKGQTQFKKFLAPEFCESFNCDGHVLALFNHHNE